MKRITFRIAVVVAAAASSCGSVCARIDSAQTALFVGKSECSSSSGGTVTLKRVALQCDTEACQSESDQQVLAAYAHCLSTAPACTAGNEDAAINAALACAVAADREASDDCKTALSE